MGAPPPPPRPRSEWARAHCFHLVVHPAPTAPRVTGAHAPDRDENAHASP